MSSVLIAGHFMPDTVPGIILIVFCLGILLSSLNVCCTFLETDPCDFKAVLCRVCAIAYGIYLTGG